MNNAPERAEQLDEDVNEEAITADVSIPGPYPSGDVSDRGDADEPEPTKEERAAGSLGDLTTETSTSTVAEESGGLGSPTGTEGG
jgi:hypothetical protein